MKRTYDQNQIEKPLKTCAKCGKPWYMLADVCAECRDPYAVRDSRITNDVRDCQGVVIDGP